MTDRQSTHDSGCWSCGPKHYECAMREIERLRKMSQDAYQRGLQAGSRGLREVYDAVQKVKSQDAWDNTRLTEALMEAEERAERAEAENKRLRCIISDLKDWDCDVSGGFLSIPLDLRRRMQEAIDAALTAQPAISGYTCTVPDDCETLHWRGQILSMNELASVAQPAAGEEIHVHIEGQDVLTLPLASSGMSAPRFVVHVPWPEQPEPDESALVLVEALVDARAFTLEHDSGRSGVVRDRIDAALARAKGVLG